ncbi:MAG: GntR family transcriptional regulator [Oscillospiraceae bacterium]|nr:GntR family transcriptional regulator [Oscillospiraceae bacterium]
MEYHVAPRTEAMEKLENFIAVNRLTAHTRIPSERDLCEMWGINRTTLRFAVDTLVEYGRLYRVRGSGVYVAESKTVRNIVGVNSMSMEMQQQGIALTSKILSMRVIEATKQVAKKLRTTLGKKVYECIRLRYINSIPCIIETLYLDCETCPDFDKYYSDRASMGYIYKNIYHLNQESGEENISVTYLSAEEAQLMDAKEGEPAFFTTGFTKTDKGQILEFYQSIFRADIFKMVSVISKD